MDLSERQRRFTRMVASLLAFALDKNGVEITLGEAFRTPEQQTLYVKAGKSRTSESLHCHRLAIDLFLWKDGEVTWKIEDYEFLGKKWESLGGVWGGRWPRLKDAVHFQYGDPRSPEAKEGRAGEQEKGEEVSKRGNESQ